jgi:transposase, IS5 family
MRKLLGQNSLVDALVSKSSRRGEGRLDRIAQLIDWAPVVAIASQLSTSRTGRPSFPPEVMIKALLLAQWYRLSDPELEECLADRLSFRRFVGLSLQDKVPDETTVCRFRGALAEHGLSELLLAEVNRQLEAKHLFVKAGTIIDASVVQASVKPPATGEDTSPQDPDAKWLNHGDGRGRFGFKAHIAVDLGLGLIRKALMTPAATHDSQPADQLMMGDEKAVYADKAYQKKERRAALRASGIKDRIMHKSQRAHPLTFWQTLHNTLIAGPRRTIERTFGTWKRSYGYTRVRYRGLSRNGSHLQLLCIAFNLRKAEAAMG